MSHALADVVHAEQIRAEERRRIAYRIRAELVCCDIYERDAYTDRAGTTHAICFWGEAAARLAEGREDDLTEREDAESHTVPLSYDTESTTAAVLHAVDNLTDGYPALIPEAELADDDARPVRVCQASGNTVRGPLVPVEINGERRHFCVRCFDAYRRSVAHLDDPLPLSEGPVL